MVKNLNQDQVKSQGEEENKKPGLWKRIKQPLKLLGLIVATIVGFLLGGPIAALVIGGLAYGHYRKKNRADSTPKPGNESHKSNNNESKEKSKEESKTKNVQPPGFIKKALYRAGAIAVGLMLGGPIGAVIAGIFVAIDIMSNGKVIQGVEKLLDASYGALSWSGKKALGIGKWAVDKIRSSGQEHKTGLEAAGKERETGKEQVAGRGVAGKERGGNNLPAGFSNPHYSPPAVQAENPNASVVKAAPGGQGDDGNPTNKTMSRKVQEEVAHAGAEFAEAANPVGGVEVEETVRQSSPGEMQRSQSVDRLNGTGHQQSNKATSKTTDNIDDRGLRERADKLMENLRQPSTGGPSTSNQPVLPKTQGQAAQPAKPEDGVKAEGTNPKRPVVGPATGGLAQESPGKGFERGSSN